MGVTQVEEIKGGPQAAAAIGAHTGSRGEASIGAARAQENWTHGARSTGHLRAVVLLDLQMGCCSRERRGDKTPLSLSPSSISFLAGTYHWPSPTGSQRPKEALGAAHLGQTHRADSRQSRYQVDLRANEENPAVLGKAFWDNKMVKLGGNPSSLVPLTIPGICPPLGYKAPSAA